MCQNDNARRISEMAIDVKTPQFGAAQSAGTTAETHPPLKPKLDYVWKWLLIVLRESFST
jgi:hypothetical protein